VERNRKEVIEMRNIWFFCSRKEQKVTPHVCRKRCDRHETCAELEQFEVDALVMPDIDEHLGRMGLNTLPALRRKLREVEGR
jgi:hypothetical protein